MKNETKAKAVKLGTKIILKFIGADLLGDGAGFVYELTKDSLPDTAKTLIDATTDSVADFFSDEAGDKAKKLFDGRERKVNFHLARGICRVWEASLTASLPKNRAANSKYVLFPADSFQEFTEQLEFFIEYFKAAQKKGDEHLLEQLFYDRNKSEQNFYADFFDGAQNEESAEQVYWETLQKTLLKRLAEADKKPSAWRESFPDDFSRELKEFLFENLRLGLKEIFNTDEDFRNSFVFSVNLLTVDLIKKSLAEIKSEIDNAGIENRFNFSQVRRQLDDISDDIRQGFRHAFNSASSQTDGNAEEANKIVRQILEILSKLRESPEIIYRCFHKSFPRVPNFFTGRRKVLEDLEKTLEKDNQASFYGTHGLGKTRTAVEYALRHRENYELMLFISATKGNFVSNAAIVGAEISEEIEKATSLEAKFNLFIKLLEKRRNWLVICDNVEDVLEMKNQIPQQFDGKVIYTSNLRDIKNVAPMVTIEAMTPEEAELTLLRRKLENNDAELEDVSAEERAAITKIVEKIGTLPIGLNLAGAFINKYQMNFREYLQDYEQFEAATFQDFDLADYYGENFLKNLNEDEKAEYKGVAGVFLLSYQRIITPKDDSENEKLTSQTLEIILNLSVFLAPEKIPEEIWLEGLKLHDKNLAKAAENKLFWLKVRERLTQAAFFIRNEDDNTSSTHRLIQAILQKRLTDEEKRRFAELAVDSVDNLFPDVKFENWNYCNRLQKHVETVLIYAENLAIETQNAARLYNQIAYYTYNLAEYEKAIVFHQKVIKIDEQTIGKEHPDYAININNLALVYVSQGKYDEAIELFRQAIKIDEKTIGKEHPTYATRLNNLAMAYYLQDRYDEAIELYQQAIGISEQTIGKNHLNYAFYLNNLAGVYQSQGKYDEAIELLKQAIGIGEQTIGKLHPDYAKRLNNLALVYYSQGRYDEAIELYQQALKIGEKTIGKEHPNYAIRLNNLALVYDSQGRYNEAIELYQQVLEIDEKTIGKEHPNYAIRLNNLADVYQSQDRYDEAIELYQQAIEIDEKTIGKEHPDYAIHLNNLANVYRLQGRYDEALPLYEESLRILGNSLPENHPTIQIVRGNFEKCRQMIEED
jgi:tetratricopeptide (TPR) repeat protein